MPTTAPMTQLQSAVSGCSPDIAECSHRLQLNDADPDGSEWITTGCSTDVVECSERMLIDGAVRVCTELN